MYRFVKKATKCECGQEQFNLDTGDSNMLILYFDEPQVFKLTMSFHFEGGVRYPMCSA